MTRGWALHPLIFPHISSYGSSEGSSLTSEGSASTVPADQSLLCRLYNCQAGGRVSLATWNVCKLLSRTCNTSRATVLHGLGQSFFAESQLHYSCLPCLTRKRRLSPATSSSTEVVIFKARVKRCLRLVAAHRQGAIDGIDMSKLLLRHGFGF